MQHEFHEDEGRHWPRVVGYVLAAVIVAVVAVFLGRTVYRSVRHNPTKPQTTTGVRQTFIKQSPKTPAKNPPDNPTPNQLPNNGPGNIVALFTVSALASGGLHYALKRRRGA